MSSLKELNEGDMGMCKLVAGIRTASARRSGIPRPFDMGYHKHVENEEAGIIAEYAFCRTYNLFFNGVYGGSDDGYDCILNGKRIDVKSTTSPNGNLLVQKDTKKDNVDVYVLIQVIDHVPKLMGWIAKDELLVEENLKTMPNKTVCYFKAKQDLHKWERR